MGKRDELRAMADSYGLDQVLRGLSAYCMDNADAIGTSDIVLADAWRANARVILQAMNKLGPIAR